MPLIEDKYNNKVVLPNSDVALRQGGPLVVHDFGSAVDGLKNSSRDTNTLSISKARDDTNDDRLRFVYNPFQILEKHKNTIPADDFKYLESLKTILKKDFGEKVTTLVIPEKSFRDKEERIRILGILRRLVNNTAIRSDIENTLGVKPGLIPIIIDNSNFGVDDDDGDSNSRGSFSPIGITYEKLAFDEDNEYSVVLLGATNHPIADERVRGFLTSSDLDTNYIRQAAIQMFDPRVIYLPKLAKLHGKENPFFTILEQPYEETQITEAIEQTFNTLAPILNGSVFTPTREKATAEQIADLMEIGAFPYPDPDKNDSLQLFGLPTTSPELLDEWKHHIITFNTNGETVDFVDRRNISAQDVDYRKRAKLFRHVSRIYSGIKTREPHKGELTSTS